MYIPSAPSCKGRNPWGFPGVWETRSLLNTSETNFEKTGLVCTDSKIPQIVNLCTISVERTQIVNLSRGKRNTFGHQNPLPTNQTPWCGVRSTLCLCWLGLVTQNPDTTMEKCSIWNSLWLVSPSLSNPGRKRRLKRVPPICPFFESSRRMSSPNMSLAFGLNRGAKEAYLLLLVKQTRGNACFCYK